MAKRVKDMTEEEVRLDKNAKQRAYMKRLRKDPVGLAAYQKSKRDYVRKRRQCPAYLEEEREYYHRKKQEKLEANG